MNITFKSLTGIFEIELPESWEASWEDNVYSFVNPQEIEGVLQVSAYTGKMDFDPDKELKKVLVNHPSATIQPVGIYHSIHYAIGYINDGLISYEWIIGEANIKLFCTLLINANQTEERLDDAYVKAHSILGSIRINPTEPKIE